MKITVNDSREIHAIQQEFSALFPYLKLEFFPKSDGNGKRIGIADPVSAAKTLNECRTIRKAGVVTIIPGMTVRDLAGRFRDVYGLEVQLLRNSGKIWLETTLTDDWTLEEQNLQGEALNR
ncbi:MAG: hypothetical protein ACJ77K_02290 [Bacteroidia bacterium]